MEGLQLVLELLAETGILAQLYPVLGRNFLSSEFLKVNQVGHYVAGIFVQDAADAVTGAQQFVSGAEMCCSLGVRLEDAGACEVVDVAAWLHHQVCLGCYQSWVL